MPDDLFLKFQSQMDISNDGETKQEDTKSNEDSGVETMEIDDKTDSETPVIERKEAEKRKRTSSSANYEVTDEQVLGTLQTIFAGTIMIDHHFKLKLPDLLKISQVILSYFLADCFEWQMSVQPKQKKIFK